ncbi:hypothetical protein ABVT39_014286 [Epinephelus coioides]
MSKNKRIVLIFGGFVTAVAAAFYPIFFYPLAHKDEYRSVQKSNRAGVNQADVQPVDDASFDSQPSFRASNQINHKWAADNLTATPRIRNGSEMKRVFTVKFKDFLSTVYFSMSLTPNADFD